MTVNVPRSANIDRVVLVSIDTFRWRYHQPYRELYPPGVWYRGVAQATFTPTSHASMFTGQNPPRHGVLNFGDTYRGDHLLKATDSVSYSNAVHPAGPFTRGFEKGTEAYKQVAFSAWHPDYERVPHFRYEHHEDHRAILDGIDRRDLTFIHDWLLHGILDHTGDWYSVPEEDDPAEFHRCYRQQVEESVRTHAAVLDALKERGLYENTLFVVWGDHGCGFHEPPDETYGNGITVSEPHARIPIAFCSPQFDETTVDAETNARSVDMVPTLQTLMHDAGLRFDPLDHPTEGVDLTAFDGELAGYTTSYKTPLTGENDGVRTQEFALINDEVKEVRQVHGGLHADYSLERAVDAPETESWLEDLYHEVRQQPSKLIVT